MRILLINPPDENLISSELPKFIIRGYLPKYAPPLGILYIASYLQKYSPYKIFIFDYKVRNFTENSFKEDLLKISPDVVGITGHSVNWIDILNIAKLVKKTIPFVHVILGGAHATLFPKESLRHKDIDYVIIGEGENVFLKLLRNLEKGNLAPSIKGIAYRKNSQVYIGKKNSGPEDLDKLPFPTKFYKNSVVCLYDKYDYARVITSRGCPFHCNFCINPNRKYRFRSTGKIVDEIEEWKNMGFETIYFVDAVFNILPRKVISLSREILRRKINVKWLFRARIDNITENMLREVKKAGCYRIEYGIETWSNKGLRILNKEISISQISETIKLTKKIGINTLGFFMIGCPHEKETEDLEKNLYFAKRLKLDQAVFAVLTLYPQSKLYDIAVKNRIIDGNKWYDFVTIPDTSFYPPVWEEFFDRKLLFKYLIKAYLLFNIHPERLIKKIFYIISRLNLKKISQILRIG